MDFIVHLVGRVFGLKKELIKSVFEYLIITTESMGLKYVIWTNCPALAELEDGRN